MMLVPGVIRGDTFIAYIVVHSFILVSIQALSVRYIIKYSRRTKLA
jgi:hypothetical protein